MKKFIVTFLLSLIAIVAFSQELTKTERSLNKGDNYFSYPSITVADTLNGGQDSILYPIFVGNQGLAKIDVGISLKKRSANDTTVHVCLYGKYFANDTWQKIGTSGAISSNVTSATNTFLKYSYGTAVSYRYIRVHLSIVGTKSTGVKVNSVEISLPK